VCRCGYTNQEDSIPHVVGTGSLRKNNHERKAGIDKHGGFPCLYRAPAFTFHKPHRQPSAGNAGNARHNVHHCNGHAYLHAFQTVLGFQKSWKPEQHKPPDAIGKKLAKNKGP
jgi:hypothetical protein